MESAPTNAEEAPARGWRIAFLVACTIGLCLSLDLLRLHVKVHNDPNYQSYCAINEFVNCETEALSEWSTNFGLPTAAWGAFGYLLMACLAIWGLQSRRRTPSWPFGLLFVISAFCSLLAVWFGFVSFAFLASLCIVCAGTWLTSLTLLFLSFRALRRCHLSVVAAVRAEIDAVRYHPAPFVAFSTGALAVLLILWALTPRYWDIQQPPRSANVLVGDNEAGHPWIGAVKPKLTITEFSDYQCPHCQRGHEELRKLIEEMPDAVRLVHVHYPLDASCNPELDRVVHPNACEYARFAHCAQEQGRFWDANDYLFTHGRRRDPITVNELAEAAGLRRDSLANCTNSVATTRAIAHNVAMGRDHHVRGTPTFLIGHEIYPGRIPPEVLIEALGLQE